MRGLVSFLFILCIFFSYDTAQYSIFLFILLISTLLFSIKGGKSIGKIQAEDMIVLAFLFVHVYGILLGFYYNNKFEYIVRNFAGIFIYSSYFILSILRLNFFFILRLIQKGLLIYFLLVILRVILNLESLDYVIGTHGGFSSSGQPRVFSGFFASFGLFLGLAFYNFEQKRYLTFIANIALCVLVFIYVASSKGFALILLLISIIYLLLNFRRFISPSNTFILGLIVSVVYFSMSFFNYGNIITSIFATDDISNIERYSQLYTLFDEIQFFGKGVGAVFTSFERSSEFPYAIELVYLNIFHKYGFFAICFILGIVYTHYKLWKLYLSRKNRLEILKLIGLMAYTIAALGNPSLFAPSFVIYHSLTLYYLKYNEMPWFNHMKIKNSL